MTDPQQPVFSIEKVYVKDASIETPNSPQAFLEPAQPQVEVQLQNAAQRLNDALYEAVVTVTVTAKAGSGRSFSSRPRRPGSSRSSTSRTPTWRRFWASDARTSSSRTRAR